MVLSLTMMHDAHLAASPDDCLATKCAHDSLMHWNTATKLFNIVLSKPIPTSYKDAIWATGALLGTASMAYMESADPEKAWPLKVPDPNDLDWLRLSEGKRAVWQIAEPARPESIFHHLGKLMSHADRPDWTTQPPDFAAIPPQHARLFDITPESTLGSNLYYLPLLILRRLRDTRITRDNLLAFLHFLLYMPTEFRNLLELKDPRAMLLLLWWFRKVQEGEHALWWITRRARVEGRAIEIWLESFYGGEEGLMALYERVRGGGQESGTVSVGRGDQDAASGHWWHGEGEAAKVVRDWAKEKGGGGVGFYVGCGK